jgi:hypothetical protein
MELRYQGPTVTYVSKGNGTILNVLGAGAVGQLWSTREFIFYNHENMILQPGEGIAMYSEAAGSANQYAKFSIEWEEEPNSSATPPQNEFIYNIGELTGLATTNYNYTSFFNPANSNITAIIHNIYLGVDSINSAAYRIFDIRRISNASGGVLTNQSDMPKKNTGSNISVMQVRYGNPNVTMLGSSDSRIISVQSSGTTGSAVAPQLSGTQSIQFPGEDLVLRPGEGIVLYNEGAGNVNWKTNLFIVWQ